MLSAFLLAPTAPTYTATGPTALVTTTSLRANRHQVETEAMELLIYVEGFTARPKWDVNANRNGHGTVAAYPGEVLTKVQAYARALSTLRKHTGKVREHYPHLDERQTAALGILRYNVGSFGPSLRRAIKSGCAKAIAAQMRRYVNSAGTRLQGLADRRELEISFFKSTA